MQLHGLTQLHAAFRLSASATGPAGSRAVILLDHDVFDYYAAEAIATGAVDVEVALLETCLGVLSLAQLGLHFWYDGHVFIPGKTSILLALARALSFVRGGRLDIQRALIPFILAWFKALGAEDDIPHVDIYFALVKAITRTIHTLGAERVVSLVDSVPIPWPAFALARFQAWEEDSCGHIDGHARKLPTLLDLRLLVRPLCDCARACTLAHPDVDAMRHPLYTGGIEDADSSGFGHAFSSAREALGAAWCTLRLPPPGDASHRIANVQRRLLCVGFARRPDPKESPVQGRRLRQPPA